MTSKLTRDIIQSEIADFFAGVVEIHTELGGPNTVEEAQNQLTERVLACVPVVDSEPVAWQIRTPETGVTYVETNPQSVENIRNGYGIKVEITPLYRHAQQPVVQCPYPCGWDTLNKLAIQDAAFVARGLVEGEPVTESLRQAAISSNDCLLKVIAACRAAMLQAGNSPVIPEGYVMVPKEPTVNQWAAGMQAFDSGVDKVTRVYKAMLAAAPLEVQGES